MQLITKFNKGFLLCVIDIYSWVVMSGLFLYYIKKDIKLYNAFLKNLNFSCKPNKIWVDKNTEFYNKSMKSWLQDNDTEMHSRHNVEKSAVVERYIETIQNLLNQYNHTYHRTIKMKPVDVKLVRILTLV